MTSSRIIFLLLAIILIVIVVVSSGRIATSLRSRFSKFLPNLTATRDASITVTPTPKIDKSPTPTAAKKTSSTAPIDKKSTPTEKIPATGPTELAWLILSGSLLTVATLKYIISHSTKD